MKNRRRHPIVDACHGQPECPPADHRCLRRRVLLDFDPLLPLLLVAAFSIPAALRGGAGDMFGPLALIMLCVIPLTAFSTINFLALSALEWILAKRRYSF
jgi:hypothetical protein